MKRQTAKRITVVITFLAVLSMVLFTILPIFG